MYNIARQSILAQFCRYLAHFVFRFIGDTAHPETECPERWHRTATRQRRIFGKNLFGIAQENKQVKIFVARINYIVLIKGLAEIKCHRRACMREHAITVAAHEKWYGLV